MKKEIVLILLSVFVIPLLSGIVSASLYADKIPDPSRFTSIYPLWSAILEKQDGSTITLSLIEFGWLNPDGKTSKTTMFYLNDGIDEYISDKSSFSYLQEYDYICSDEHLYNDCVSACGNDESCIDQCVEDYNCHSEMTCTQNGPDNTCGVEKSTSSYGSNNIVLNFNSSNGQVFGTSIPTELETILNMCFGLSESECNQYKIDFIQRIIDKYTYYHNNYNSLISQYNQDVIFIDWDNNLSIGSPVGGEHAIDPAYSLQLLPRINNTQHDIVYNNLDNPHLITRYQVHGYPRVIGIGLTFENETDEYNRIYTTNEEFVRFSFKQGNPGLFYDATACGSWVIWDPGQTFCCWPQAMQISGIWTYFNFDRTGPIQNFRRYFASEGFLGKSYIKTAHSHYYLHGDITAHVPYAENSTPECGWADKQGIECICEPNETKNQLAVIIKEGGIYDNSNLINSISSFTSSVESDLGISGDIQKFSGSTFEEFDLFIEDLYYNSNVSYVILIGEDLPITQIVPGPGGTVLYGAQELGIVNNSRIVPPRLDYCYDVAISYIIPPLHTPTECKNGQSKCENNTLYNCQNNLWVGGGISCEEEAGEIPGTLNGEELRLITQNGYLSAGRIS